MSLDVSFSLFEFYGLHILISALVAYIASALLLKRFENQRLELFVLVLLFNLAIPVLGYFFTIWVVYFLINVTYSEVVHGASMINLEEFESGFVEVKRVFGEGSMTDLLENEYASTSQKIKALVAMSDKVSKENVAIIKTALSNSDDEIRLFSFAIIDKMEREINATIHNVLIKYQENDDRELAKQLAFLYWELVYFELSDEVLQNYLIGESLKYINAALSKEPNDTALRVLRGRIHLKRKQYNNAATEFSFAIEADEFNASQVYPYLAQLQYESRNFVTTQAILKQAYGLQYNATLHPVIKMWGEVS